jgi:hypothetical protein
MNCYISQAYKHVYKIPSNIGQYLDVPTTY